jgi:hypothetical protein
MFEYNLVITFYILHAQDKCSLYNDELYSIMKNIYLFSLKCTTRWCKIKYRKNKSINRLKNLKYRNIYIKIDRNRMLDIVIHYSYVWNLSQGWLYCLQRRKQRRSKKRDFAGDQHYISILGKHMRCDKE